MRQIEQRLVAQSAIGESTEQNSDDIKTKITYNL
jgi:hypothetical protein